jgi:hypothetical protein
MSQGRHVQRAESVHEMHMRFALLYVAIQALRSA